MDKDVPSHGIRRGYYATHRKDYDVVSSLKLTKLAMS